MNSDKFQVVLTNCLTHDVKIIGTYHEYDKSIAFLTEYIETQFHPDSYVKCFHDSKYTVSIFEYYYLFPKRMIYKVHIIPYADIL